MTNPVSNQNNIQNRQIIGEPFSTGRHFEAKMTTFRIEIARLTVIGESFTVDGGETKTNLANKLVNLIIQYRNGLANLFRLFGESEYLLVGVVYLYTTHQFASYTGTIENKRGRCCNLRF